MPRRVAGRMSVDSMQTGPPARPGALSRREAGLAWGLLAPTLASVGLVIILPLLAIFWISFKPIGLADLRPPTPGAYERLRGDLTAVGDVAELEYRLSNSSRETPIRDVQMRDRWPDGLRPLEVDPRCRFADALLACDFGDWEPGFRERLRIPVEAAPAYIANPVHPRALPAELTGDAESPLFNADFTLDNFRRVFDSGEFVEVLGVTVFYTVFGTLGALIAGLFAALLLNQPFRGRGALRGLFLFPYVAPVIAVAFAWVNLFDPFSGSANALLLQMGVVDSPINFFGQRPQALIMVTVFEIWRYFPLSFLFILARMQSIDTDMYEAADMDGASPFQQFFFLSLPQLLGILSILFLLRFIWTFNKFDDIFLLTGGNAGTRTLTVNVYEQAFAVSNIGAGAAVAVVIFGCLTLFALFFFRMMSREEGL